MTAQELLSGYCSRCTTNPGQSEKGGNGEPRSRNDLKKKRRKEERESLLLIKQKKRAFGGKTGKGNKPAGQHLTLGGGRGSGDPNKPQTKKAKAQKQRNTKGKLRDQKTETHEKTEIIKKA